MLKVNVEITGRRTVGQLKIGDLFVYNDILYAVFGYQNGYVHVLILNEHGGWKSFDSREVVDTNIDVEINVKRKA